MNTITIEARAKINLALSVLYKRDDGFHEIESVMQEIDFADRLSLSPHTELRFSSNSEHLNTAPENLCLRAAAMLQENYGIPGLDIKLEKNIPMGAGLGGGSSDAAAVLTAGLRLYGMVYRHDDLSSMAAALGSDVPFFLQGGTCLATGRGEILHEVSLDKNYLVLLVLPQVSVSTAWAYKNLKMGLTKERCDNKFIGFKFQDLKAIGFRSEFKNDFEKVVFAAYPQLAEIKESLYRCGADFAAMSGSGSSIYGIFTRAETAGKAQEELQKKYDCRVVRPT